MKTFLVILLLHHYFYYFFIDLRIAEYIYLSISFDVLIIHIILHISLSTKFDLINKHTMRLHLLEMLLSLKDNEMDLRDYDLQKLSEI
ncbi:hypothetical protein V6Z11_D01G260800 [Gossypium hirsutum]